MADVVKEPLDIDINYKMKVHSICQKHCPCDSVMRAAVWTKPIAVFVKFCFTDWFQYLFDTLLNDTVLYCGYSERA